MRLVLRIIRSTGHAESYELFADGDVVHVPHPLMTSEDVVGLEVDLGEGEAEEWPTCVAGAQAGGAGMGPRGI